MTRDPRIAFDARTVLDHFDLVPPPRPPVRRLRRSLHLLLSQHSVSGRLIAACSALPAAWTIAMIALAWHLRF